MMHDNDKTYSFEDQITYILKLLISGEVELLGIKGLIGDSDVSAIREIISSFRGKLGINLEGKSLKIEKYGNVNDGTFNAEVSLLIDGKESDLTANFAQSGHDKSAVYLYDLRVP